MSASKLQSVLSGNPALAVLVDDRIAISPADQGTARPFVVYEFDSDDPIRDLTGVADLVRQNWTVFIQADKFMQADEVKQAVINALGNESTEFYATFQGSSYTFDDSADYHQFELNYTLLYK